MNISSFSLSHGIWRGGRVVECTGLENQQGFTPFGGSNPPLSAMRLTNFTDQKTNQQYVKTYVYQGVIMFYLVLKTSKGSRPSGVRIPPSPPTC